MKALQDKLKRQGEAIRDRLNGIREKTQSIAEKTKNLSTNGASKVTWQPDGLLTAAIPYYSTKLLDIDVYNYGQIYAVDDNHYNSK